MLELEAVTWDSLGFLDKLSLLQFCQGGLQKRWIVFQLGQYIQGKFASDHRSGLSNSFRIAVQAVKPGGNHAGQCIRDGHVFDFPRRPPMAILAHYEARI